MVAEKTAQIMVRVTPEMFKRLQSEAERDDRTMAQIARIAIEDYLSVAEAREL